MPPTTLHLLDDAVARGWEPVSLTRPAGDLLFGALRMWERASQVFGLPCTSLIAGSGLEGYDGPGSPPCGIPEATDGIRVLLLSRAVPEAPPASGVTAEGGWTELAGCTLMMDGEVVGWVLAPGTPIPTPDRLLHPEQEGGRRVEVPGSVLSRPWELMARNPDRLARDLAALPPLRGGGESGEPELPGGVFRMGDHPLQIGPEVEIEPGVVFDLREGAIRLERGVKVRAFTRLAGPAWIGPGSILLGGTLGRLSVGPECRLRGEIEDSIIHGFTNKAHDGFLGHALVGSWVNLGALTTNSDLKNSYGTVRVRTGAGVVDTGLMKVGCLLGDHVKTGIGTLLNTGANIGAGSMLAGGGMQPARVPPFAWAVGGALEPQRLDAFLSTAERVMARRGVRLSEAMRALLTRAHAAHSPPSGDGDA
jgi:UDP-N-acetylglucosamine diphosphorylase / glucose-1-phosphate thymidylyltransferase / UDP-N-acetylgalactosamine diphosphorylase / glucosamine-1-phosphate N-acetyltransferase / galactosamine-1-phosphate N-acetyltransferase